MIQGVGAVGTSPNPQIERLTKHYTCLTFDNRGIGASQPAGRKVTVEQMASDALRLLDEVGWESAHVVGHSLGSLTALQLALRAKKRVRTLTLLCAFARGADAVQLSAALLWIIARIKLGPRWIRRQAFMELVLAPEELRAARRGGINRVARRLEGVLGHDLGDIPPVTSAQVAAMRSQNLTPRLRELAGIPTLVINGEKDPLAKPASGKALAAAIPGARYMEIRGTSHAMPILQDEACAKLILEHLRQHEAVA
jgi:pimeloyl-ACP methyl ester carboxylesterase